MSLLEKGFLLRVTSIRAAWWLRGDNLIEEVHKERVIQELKEGCT